MTDRPANHDESFGDDSPIERITQVRKLPARKSDSHKGDYGRILIIGGSRGMVGAPALTANAALRSGAGLVTIACPESIQQSVAVLCPCATTIALRESSDGRLDPSKALQSIDVSGMFGELAMPSAVAAGPGLGRGNTKFDNAWQALIQAFAIERGVPVVVDADGLNALPHVRGLDRHGGASEITKQAAAAPHSGPLGSPRTFAWENLVLTPHPGEMARLCQSSVTDVQSRRERIAIEFAQTAGPDAGLATVLKGAGTIVTDGRRIYVNQTGNPGMATGGSGDVLTGIIAALIGQGLSRFDAAVLGTFVHGRAGDLAGREMTQISMTASDIVQWLPQAFASL